VILTMIVKNEEKTLPRALSSARHHVDDLCVLDTGSTDGTLDILRGCSATWMPATFKNFSQARNEAIMFAEVRSRETMSDPCVYTLMLDADQTLEVADPNWRSTLTADLGMVRVIEGDLEWWAPLLRRVGCDLWYEGATHEAIPRPEGRYQTVPGITVRHHADGGSRANKLTRDRALLEAALKADPTDLRSLYYLAQTVYAQGEFVLAGRLFAQRALAGGWEEEAWHAALMECRVLARDSGRQGALSPWLIGRYLSAWERRPERAEPIADLLGALSPVLAERLAKLIEGVSPPEGDVLFIERAAYSAGERTQWQIARSREQWGFCAMLATRMVDQKAEPAVWWHRALIGSLWQTGRQQEAKTALDSALALAPDDPGLLQDASMM
jgi:tetratricopeptide (TPR) repeat protein